MELPNWVSLIVTVCILTSKVSAGRFTEHFNSLFDLFA